MKKYLLIARGNNKTRWPKYEKLKIKKDKTKFIKIKNQDFLNVLLSMFHCCEKNTCISKRRTVVFYYFNGELIIKSVLFPKGRAKHYIERKFYKDYKRR